MEKGSEFYPGPKSCLSSEIITLEVEEVDQIGVLDQPILTRFPMVLGLDEGRGSRDSIQHCYEFSGGVCTPTE